MAALGPHHLLRRAAHQLNTPFDTLRVTFADVHRFDILQVATNRYRWLFGQFEKVGHRVVRLRMDVDSRDFENATSFGGGTVFCRGRGMVIIINTLPLCVYSTDRPQ